MNFRTFGWFVNIGYPLTLSNTSYFRMGKADAPLLWLEKSFSASENWDNDLEKNGSESWCCVRNATSHNS